MSGSSPRRPCCWLSPPLRPPLSPPVAPCACSRWRLCGRNSAVTSRSLRPLTSTKHLEPRGAQGTQSLWGPKCSHHHAFHPIEQSVNIEIDQQAKASVAQS